MIKMCTGGPPLTRFSLPRIPLPKFWLMYAQVLLTQILRNVGFFKSQIPRKAGTSVHVIDEFEAHTSTINQDWLHWICPY